MEIFIWDHNKERLFERACTIIDEETDKMVAGLAFHWYSGDHFEALDLVQRRFPGKKMVLSEACIEYSKFDKSNYLDNAQKYAHDIIGNINNGMTAFYDWNLVLDAPYLYDIKNNELMERNTLAYIWHFSHFMEPGSIRIGSTKYTEAIEVSTLLTPSGEIIAVLLNRTDEDIDVCFRLNGKICNICVKAKGIGTAIIE